MPRREPIRWPDNARIAVVVAVPYETWPEDTGWSFGVTILAHPTSSACWAAEIGGWPT